MFTGPWTGAKQPGLVDERRARGGEQEDEGRRRVGGGGQEEGRRKRAEGKVNTVFYVWVELTGRVQCVHYSQPNSQSFLTGIVNVLTADILRNVIIMAMCM